MCIEHARWEGGHGERPVEAGTPPLTATARPSVTVETASPTTSVQPTSAPTGAPGAPVTATPEIVIEYRDRIVEVASPPYPCLWTIITAQVSVGEQLTESAKAGVLACDPDSAVVPRVTLDLP